jgi:1-acyl-sn-glycerol-3-phosphate acyltransferase
MSDRAYIGTGRWLLWKFLIAVWSIGGIIPFRTETRGTETLPKTGAYLLLANHTSTLDSVWVAHPIGRPAHFMASASLFRNPVIGTLLRWVGAFPKEVFVKDKKSSDTVDELFANGQVVQIMPEGARSWEGHLMPIRKGIGRLAQKLDGPVVVCRVETGHLWFPRWAVWPRWVPLRMAYSKPLTWPETASVDEIWADIVREMTIPVTADFSGSRTFGFRTAEGLETLLWACPTCFALDQTHGHRDEFRCRACGASWTIGVDNRMDGDNPTTVADAYAAIHAHFGAPPRSSEAVILQERDVEMMKIEKGKPIVSAARGHLTLFEDRLALDTGWSLPLRDIVAINMDAGNVLHLRTTECIWRLVPHGGSTWKWQNFVQPWWEKLKEEAAS